MGKRILVLDDDPGVLEAIDLSLSYCGFQVKPLLSADNLFAIIESFRPRLIILDYLLRGKNGGEICLELKNDPIKKDIPVIMLSAYPEAAIGNFQFKCDSFLPKPFDLTSLVNEINIFISADPLLLKK